MTTGNDVLMDGGGAKAAKFDNVGDTWTGRIVSPPEAYVVTEFGSQEPRRYPSGDPIQGVKVTIATDVRDPSDPEDDGERRLFLDGKRIKEAVRDAVLKTGAQGLEVGGVLTIAYTGNGEPPGKGMFAPKLFAASYQRPAQAAASAALGVPQAAQPAAAVQQPMGGAAWAQQVPAAPVAPQYPQQAPPVVPATPNPAAPPVAYAQQPAAVPQAPQPGADPALAAALGNLSPEVVAALRVAGQLPPGV